MYFNEHLFNRLAQDRRRDLTRHAEQARLLAAQRPSLRRRLALTLVAAASRLEPNLGAEFRHGASA
jgi:hypothetical protein